MWRLFFPTLSCPQNSRTTQIVVGDPRPKYNRSENCSKLESTLGDWIQVPVYLKKFYVGIKMTLQSFARILTKWIRGPGRRFEVTLVCTAWLISIRPSIVLMSGFLYLQCIAVCAWRCWSAGRGCLVVPVMYVSNRGHTASPALSIIFLSKLNCIQIKRVIYWYLNAASARRDTTHTGHHTHIYSLTTNHQCLSLYTRYIYTSVYTRVCV